MVKDQRRFIGEIEIPELKGVTEERTVRLEELTILSLVEKLNQMYQHTTI